MKRALVTLILLVPLLLPAVQAASHEGVHAAPAFAGREATWTFGVTRDGCIASCFDWPTSGTANITFPAEFTLPAPSALEVTVTVEGQDDSQAAEVVGNLDNVLQIARQGTGAAAGPDDEVVITVDGLINPSQRASTGDFLLVLDAGDGDAEDFNLDGIAIPAGEVPVDITVLDPVSGSVTDYTFEMQIGSAIPDGGDITLSFPSGYDGVGDVANATVTIDGTPATASVTTVDSSTVQIEPAVMVSAGTSYAVTIPGIRNKAVSSTGSSGAFSITTDRGDGTLEQNATADVTLVPELANLTIDASDLQAGLTADYTFTFMATRSVPADGGIQVTFPEGYDLQAADAQISGTDLSAQTVTVDDLTIDLVVSAGINSGGLRVLTVTNVTNPLHAGSSGAFQFGSFDDDGVDVERNQTAHVTLTPGSLTNVTITKDDARQNALAAYRFAFNHTNPIPAGGKVRVTFPAGYAVAGNSDRIGTASVTSLAVAGRYESSPITARNPDRSGNTGTFTIETLDAQGRIIDVHSGAKTSINAPVPLPAGNVTVDLPGVHTYAEGSVGIRFAPSTTVPTGGSVTLQFPQGYVLHAGGTSTGVGDPDAGGSVRMDAANRSVTLEAVSTPFTPGDAYTFNVSHVRTPAVRSAPGHFIFSSRDDEGARLDRATVASPAIAPAALADLNATAANRIVDTVTTYTFTFETPVVWPADGVVNITMDPGYLVEAVGATMTGPGFTGGLNVTRSGNVLSLERTGAALWVAGPKTLTVEGIVNPVAAGGVADFQLDLFGYGGAHLMTGTTGGPIILEQPDTTPPDGKPRISSDSHTSGRKSAETTVSLTWNRATDPQGEVAYHYVLSRNETATVTRAHDNTTANSITVTAPASGVWYFHVRPVSDGGLGSQSNPFVLNIVTITDQELSRIIALTSLQVLRIDGGNRVTWQLPSDMPLDPMGVQVWRSTSPYTLLLTETENVLAGTYDDMGAQKGAAYLVTPYFGETSALGFYADGEAPDTNTFQGTTIDDSIPWWTWAAIALGGLLVLALIVLAIVWIARRPKKEQAEGLVDLGAMGGEDGYGRITSVWAEEVQDQGRSHAADAHEAVAEEEHQVSCPACEHTFNLTGTLPVHAECPHCGVAGILQ